MHHIQDFEGDSRFLQVHLEFASNLDSGMHQVPIPAHRMRICVNAGIDEFQLNAGHNQVDQAPILNVEHLPGFVFGGLG
jgi:hypothetical protein